MTQLPLPFPPHQQLSPPPPQQSLLSPQLLQYLQMQEAQEIRRMLQFQRYLNSLPK